MGFKRLPKWAEGEVIFVTDYYSDHNYKEVPITVDDFNQMWEQGEIPISIEKRIVCFNGKLWEHTATIYSNGRGHGAYYPLEYTVERDPDDIPY